MLLMIAGDSALLPWPMKDYTGVPSEQQVSSARLSQARVPGWSTPSAGSRRGGAAR